jgi:CBS domain-containing protein/GNAT superfamily N-acetyltransferase
MTVDISKTTIYAYPHAFINKRGDPILITTLDEQRCQRLIEMYLAYQPRSSFQGLPPLKDEACVKWVQYMIANGINLVALSFGEGVAGHVALFPIDNLVCEMLVVVCTQLQNIGIGTELVRCGVQLAHELGFEKIRLSVEAHNFRARHVYKKCGFEYLTNGHVGEVDMALDLKRYRDTVNVQVAAVMRRDVIAIYEDQPCKAALEIFLTRHIGSLPVVDEKNEVVGIISKTDLLTPGKINKKVSDVLTRDVLTVTETCPLSKVIRVFQSRKIRAIPVVDPQRRLVGVVAREDILAYYAKHFLPPPRS